MLYCRWGRNSFWGGRALTGEPQLAVVKADDSVLGVACHVLGESGHVDTRRIAENTSAQVLLLFIMFSLRCGGMLMYFLETPEKECLKRVWATFKDVSGSNKYHGQQHLSAIAAALRVPSATAQR